jgi:hypothetical protein
VTNRPIAVMLAAAAVFGVSACGGSSKSKSTTTTVAQASATTQQVATTASSTTATSATSDKHAKKTSQTTSSSTTADPPAHHVHHHGPMPDTHKTTPLPPVKNHGKVVGPTPIVCLQGAGLGGAHASGANRWIANAGSQQIFVDGPFTSVKAAKEDAASLQGINLYKRGGLYVVSTNLTSHLNVAVDRVAGCLSATSGSGSLSF